MFCNAPLPILASLHSPDPASCIRNVCPRGSAALNTHPRPFYAYRRAFKCSRSVTQFRCPAGGGGPSPPGRAAPRPARRGSEPTCRERNTERRGPASRDGDLVRDGRDSRHVVYPGEPDSALSSLPGTDGGSDSPIRPGKDDRHHSAATGTGPGMECPIRSSPNTTDSRTRPPDRCAYNAPATGRTAREAPPRRGARGGDARSAD